MVTVLYILFSFLSFVLAAPDLSFILFLPAAAAAVCIAVAVYQKY